jgi:hypothetical protein
MHPVLPFRHAPTAALLCSAVALAGCGADGGSAEPSPPPAAFAEAPATGNGHKLVIPIDEDEPNIDCGGGEILELHIEGWIQVRTFPEGTNRNVELDMFHLVLKYTNTAGKTFTFQDAGPDHYYIDKNGNLIVASSGRLNGGLIGHIVTNLTTGEVPLVAGKEFAGGSDALACEALT